jgi:hypothetical protein
VIADRPTDPPGRHSPPDTPRLLQHEHAAAVICDPSGGHQPGNPGTDHDDIDGGRLRVHACARWREKTTIDPAARRIVAPLYRQSGWISASRQRVRIAHAIAAS